MKTLKQVTVEPVYVDFIPEALEPNKIYISEKYNTATHACLCGCGTQTITPLNERGWSLIKHGDGRISLIPSIGNYQFPCKSHYILTKNVANFV
jgi:hypothetical protein